MANSCIDAPAAQRMKQAIKDKEIDIAKLRSMSSEERRTLFGKYASEDLASFINTNFEKAIVSNQKNAMKTWAEKTFTPAERKGAGYKNVIDKINELDKLGVLTPKNREAYLEDLVTDKLGISVSAEEVQQISQRAQALETAFNIKDEVGNPSVKYWAERKKMEDYLNGLTPNPRLKVATSVAGRGAMLFSVKSPLTNIEGNTVQGLMQGLERRVASGQYRGLNGDYAVKYVKRVNQIFQKTGFDISRMDSVSSGQKRLGEEITHSQGPGAVRAVGRFYEDVVFKQMLGAPDVAASSIAFADSANLASTKIAQGEGLKGKQARQRALDIMKDATRIEPQTVDGEIVRSQAIADARYSTYTNDGKMSDFALGIRKVINDVSGDVRLGDQLMPFAKTPANVVQSGFESSGLKLPYDLFFKLPEAKRQLGLGNTEPMKDVVRSFVRAGMGMTFATAFVYGIDPDDFVGEYESMDPQKRALAGMKGAPYNAIRIGDKWISLDYLGPMGAAVTGMLYARKYGKDPASFVGQYAKGAGTQLTKVPGLREFSDLVKEIKDGLSGEPNAGQVAGALSDTAIGYIRARTVPAIVNDIAKGTDSVERQTGREAISKVKAGIPGVRQTLPAKVDQTTGESIPSEGFASTILFGSRVSTANRTEIVNEIDRLDSVGEPPTITDVTRNPRMKELQKQVPAKEFQRAVRDYGKGFGEEVSDLLDSDEYDGMDDPEKKAAINKIRQEALETVLEDYGYEKKEKDK